MRACIICIWRELYRCHNFIYEGKNLEVYFLQQVITIIKLVTLILGNALIIITSVVCTYQQFENH